MMVDKITTVRKWKVGAHVGRLDDESLEVQSGPVGFLALAAPGADEAIARDMERRTAVANVCNEPEKRAGAKQFLPDPEGCTKTEVLSLFYFDNPLRPETSLFCRKRWWSPWDHRS
ncbi:hypothetical protein [Microvirga ossetica]|uniref:hypothetical protein n=1 Tax=Microvirga ossetica TaxID=1882682 RepID=UPI001F2666B6|nr:hypothetical protein [Microvirga ossetica]